MIARQLFPVLECVSGIWTNLTWPWWFGFMLLELISANDQFLLALKVDKTTPNNQLSTFTKVQSKSPDTLGRFCTVTKQYFEISSFTFVFQTSHNFSTLFRHFQQVRTYFLNSYKLSQLFPKFLNLFTTFVLPQGLFNSLILTKISIP